MKTAEELKTLKEEVETLNAKLAELSEEELAQVSGGIATGRRYWPYSVGASGSGLNAKPEVTKNEIL